MPASNRLWPNPYLPAEAAWGTGNHIRQIDPNPAAVRPGAAIHTRRRSQRLEFEFVAPVSAGPIGAIRPSQVLAEVEDMGPSLAELLHDWHDFYVLVGTASATLVGLTFVAVSIGTRIFNEDHRAGITAFVTSTVVHFAAALFTCLLVTIPTQSWRTLGALFAAGGLAGSIYCGRLVIRITARQQFKLDLDDRLFYFLLPLLGYLLALIAAALLL